MMRELQENRNEEETTTKQKSVREEKTERDKETIAVMASAEAAPASVSAESNRTSARSSIVESLRGCGIAGIRIDKEELKRRIVIPEYLRLGMLDAIKEKDVEAVVERRRRNEEEESNKAPEAPMVVFVNAKSGGRHGPLLKERLQELMGQEQVFDLSVVKPTEFVQCGLAYLERLASLGDNCAKETRDKMRVMVAGGDGTAGWVLGSLMELNKQKREPVPPTGIIPLGTGNDLSRSFGWGGSFPFAWKAAIKKSLYKATNGPICRLDSWQVSVSAPAGKNVELPYCLRHTEEFTPEQGLPAGEELTKKLASYEGVFYNYFSIGMDAQVAYGFHHLRDEKPYLAQGPISNKLVSHGVVLHKNSSQGESWGAPNLEAFRISADENLVNPKRGLKNILRLHIKKGNCSEWEQIQVPSDVRAIVALNLHSYGSGRNPWGNLKPDYMEKRGFVESQADDGMLEIFGLKHGWHASFVMVELISAKHIAQAAAVKLEIRGGEWKQTYLQMDGEPWKQPLDKENSTFVEIKKVPFQSLMISG